MRKSFLVLGIVLIVALFMANEDCDAPASSASGVKKADVQVQVGTDGFTAEQRNIRNRLTEDNKPGAIKHLYLLSAYSGQVILYSTVKGKVTSGGKRLTPASVYLSKDAGYNGFTLNIGGRDFVTQEVMADDGTYGSSGDYLYWWDVRGAYHQLYLTGGEIVTISDQPLPVKSVTINIEKVDEK